MLRISQTLNDLREFRRPQKMCKLGEHRRRPSPNARSKRFRALLLTNDYHPLASDHDEVETRAAMD